MTAASMIVNLRRATIPSTSLLDRRLNLRVLTVALIGLELLLYLS